MLAISILVACLAAQPQPSGDFDLVALEQRIAARDRALSVFAWDFEMHRLDAEGARDSRNAEADSVPKKFGRLITDGASRRVEVSDELRERKTVTIWDGHEALTATTRISRIIYLRPLRPTYEERGSLDSVVAGYLPDSFGIGYCGFVLSHWLEHHDFTDLGLERLRERTCRKLLVQLSATSFKLRNTEFDTVRAVLWIDEESLLVMRAQSLVRVGPVAPLHQASDLLEFEGRRYAAQSTWDVLETTKVGEHELPVLGRYSRHPSAPGSAYEIDLRPQAMPPAGWPSGTFELPIVEGSQVRDARTGQTRIHRTSTTKVSSRVVPGTRVSIRSRCPGSDS